MGIMHAHGLFIDPQYHVFDAWMVYEKTKGKWARAVIDSGAIREKGDFQGKEYLWQPEAFKKSNLGSMLYQLGVFNKILKIPKIEKECEDVYLKYFKQEKEN